MTQELITEVNSKDEVLGLRARSDFSNRYHRSSCLLLFNSKNELSMQKRAMTKKWFPGLLDFSASGVVANESYEECVKRECEEELGIKPEIKFLFKITPKDDNGKAFQSVYTAVSDEKVSFDKNEAECVIWKNVPDLLLDIDKSPEKYTPQFIIGIKKYSKI